jgi:non-canonical purine NTP pyrophosphatase (RdgB/HAM1 family)
MASPSSNNESASLSGLPDNFKQLAAGEISGSITSSFIDFEQLPKVIEGESKDVRYLGKGLVAIRFKPTVYSFTHNRCDVVPGSDHIRLETSRSFLEVLKRAGIKHAYQEVLLDQKLIISKLVMPTEAEFKKYKIPPFTPQDLSREEISRLPKAAPIETIVKNTHTGTSKHRYLGMGGAMIRSTHPTLAGSTIANELPYPTTLVRFDWRNPLEHPETGKRVADEILPDRLADYFLDVEKARHTALRMNHALSEFLGARDIVLYDLCLFIAEDGELVYGEVSPDCGRFRHFFLGSLDKDVWRSGGSSNQVLEKWRLLAEIVAGPALEEERYYAIPHNTNPELRFSLGTGNPHKVHEFQAILDALDVPLEVIRTDKEPEESGETFLENARIKAVEYAKASGRIAISEDSGLVIPALNGLPGVWSARFSDCEFSHDGKLVSHTNSKRLRDEIDQANNMRVLEMMTHIPEGNREAYFEIALVVATPDGIILFEDKATCSGKIATGQSGQHGFGYDSLFIADRTDGVSFAELDPQRKNLRSHRRQVLRKFSAWISQLITKQQENLIVIDGNDGVGKSTVVAKLKELGWRVADRGVATKLTDDPTAPLPGEKEFHFILDAPVATSQERLVKAGKSLTEKYHTETDLTHYRARFLDVATSHPAFHVIHAEGPATETLKQILRVLLSPSM